MRIGPSISSLAAIILRPAANRARFPSQIGTLQHSRKGPRFGGFCVMRSAAPRTATSTIAACAIAAADHFSRCGLAFHCPGIRAVQEVVCARASLSRISARERTACTGATALSMRFCACGETAKATFVSLFRRESLQFAAAGLFKGVREVEDFGFAEGRCDDLQAHGQLAVDAAAGNGDAGKTRE